MPCPIRSSSLIRVEQGITFCFHRCSSFGRSPGAPPPPAVEARPCLTSTYPDREGSSAGQCSGHVAAYGDEAAEDGEADAVAFLIAVEVVGGGVDAHQVAQASRVVEKTIMGLKTGQITQMGAIAELQKTQLEILEKVAPKLKAGGVIVYGTCSVLRDEDETVVERFLSKHPAFSLGGAPLRVWPHRLDGGGFFGARLVGLVKVDQTLRPIACGEVLRRLAGKILCAEVKTVAAGFVVR